MTFVIIGILALVMTPVLTKRAEEARIRSAEKDLQMLADAEERAAIDTGYFYRPYVLNDIPGPLNFDGIPNAQKVIQEPRNGKDGLRDNAVTNNNLYENPTYIFIKITSGDAAGQIFYEDAMQQRLWSRLTAKDSAETDFNWNGPYINTWRDANQNDWPDDPWGNDYLLLTPKGILYAPVRDSSTQPTDTSFQFQENGPQISVGGSIQQYKASGIVDRPTWVSMGPNGLPGDGTPPSGTAGNTYGRGDDLMRKFGGS